MKKPNLVKILRTAIRRQLAGVHTSMPARVLSYDAQAQTVQVEMTVKFSRQTTDGERIPYTPPPVANVPVLWPCGGGGKYSDTWPLEKGDEMWLIFAERSIDEWVLDGEGVVEPADPRRFHLTDAVALPVRSSQTLPEEAIAEDARVIRGPEVRIGDADATEALAIASKVEERLQKLEDYVARHEHMFTMPAIPAGPSPTAEKLTTQTTDSGVPTTSAGDVESKYTFSK